MFGDALEPADQRHDVGFGIVRQPVDDPLAVALRVHKPGAAQLLEVLGGIRHAETHARRERVHAAGPLSKLLDNLDAMLMAERLGDFGESGSDHTGRTAA
jgi:hypothetical protein